jgi:hypothetical protein
MAKGKKTGGRGVGSLNKRTIAKRAEIVAAYDAGLTPLDYMLGVDSKVLLAARAILACAS